MIAKNVRFAFRTLLKNPAFALSALLSMAIAIGANSAVFSMVSGLLLHPLPYRDSDRLVQINSRGRFGSGGMSVPDFREIERTSKSFEGLAIARQDQYTLTGLERPEAVWGGGVSPEMFSLLTIRMLVGQTLPRATLQTAQ